MLGYSWVALASLIGLALQFLGHLMAARLTTGRSILRLLFIGFTIGLLGTLTATIFGLVRMEAEAFDSIAFLGMNFACYIALTFGYMNFVNLNIASLRIRVLQELLETESGLSREELLRLYSGRELIDRRIERLTGQGHLEAVDGRYVHRGQLLLGISRMVTLVKWIVLGHGNRTLNAALERERVVSSEKPS